VIWQFIIPRNGFAYLVKEVPNVWINGERFGLVRQNIKFANIVKNRASRMHVVENRCLIATFLVFLDIPETDHNRIQATVFHRILVSA